MALTLSCLRIYRYVYIYIYMYIYWPMTLAEAPLAPGGIGCALQRPWFFRRRLLLRAIRAADNDGMDGIGCAGTAWPDLLDHIWHMSTASCLPLGSIWRRGATNSTLE